jgi:hypothetical protein
VIDASDSALKRDGIQPLDLQTRRILSVYNKIERPTPLLLLFGNFVKMIFNKKYVRSRKNDKKLRRKGVLGFGGREGRVQQYKRAKASKASKASTEARGSGTVYSRSRRERDPIVENVPRIYGVRAEGLSGV